MPDRIHKYLDEMDKLRSNAEDEIDEMLKNINVKKLLQDKNRRSYFKIIVLAYLKKNGNLFLKASKEGKKLAESLR